MPHQQAFIGLQQSGRLYSFKSRQRSSVPDKVALGSQSADWEHAINTWATIIIAVLGVELQFTHGSYSNVPWLRDGTTEIHYY